MIKVRAVRGAAILTALLAASAVDAFAQLDAYPQRATHGLFGGSGRPDARNALSVTFSALGGYDTNLTAEQQSGFDPRASTDGPLWGSNIGMTYDATRGRFDLGVSGAASLRYYSTEGNFLMLGHQFAGDVGYHTDRYSVHVSQSELYSPFLMFAPVIQFSHDSADLRQTPLDAAAIRRDMLAYSTSSGGTYSFSSRSSVTGSYQFQVSDYFGKAPRQTYWSAGAVFRHTVSRSTAFRLGYTRDNGTAFSGLLPIRAHNLDVGIEYHKALGPTHRTTMSVTTGGSYLQLGPTEDYRLLLDASLNREIGRTWVAQATYHRGLGLLGGFTAPVFADTVQGSVQGLISPRVELRGSASYTTGDISTSGRRDGVKTAMASSRVRVALSQLVALYGEYLAYQYRFGNVAPLPAVFQNDVLRQSVRAGVTLWVPILR